MTILTAIITHLGGDRVKRQLAYLEQVAPDSRFVIAHGGSRSDFNEIGLDGAIFVDEPSLRGRDQDRSHTEVILEVYENFVREDPSVELVYFIEYDHLILDRSFEEELSALAERSNAGLIAKNAIRRNDTNWPHFVRYRHDERLNLFFSEISRRDDPEARWGALGTGMLFRRDALEALAAVGDLPHAYVEMFIPTITYHLGFDVVDVDAVSDLYRAIRWKPVFSVEEALAEKHAGGVFVHPFKDVDELERIKAG